MSMNQPALTLSGHALSGQVIVPAPPPQVLDYVAELRHQERWWPEHWRYRRLSGDGGPGTRYYWIYVELPGLLAGITHIEERQPDRLVYRTSMLGLPIRMTYGFQPVAEGTAVRAEMGSAGLGLGLFAKRVGKQLGAALGRLPQLLQ